MVSFVNILLSDVEFGFRELCHQLMTQDNQHKAVSEVQNINISGCFTNLPSSLVDTGRTLDEQITHQCLIQTEGSDGIALYFASPLVDFISSHDFYVCLGCPFYLLILLQRYMEYHMYSN